jgi:hypothetical protein
VAWRFLTRQSERDAVDYCLYEIPGKEALAVDPLAGDRHRGYDAEANEQSPLLRHSRSFNNNVARNARRRSELHHVIPKLTLTSETILQTTKASSVDRTAVLKDLNALEIAVISNSKRLLSQHIVQKIITSLWHGDIIFWDSVSIHATRKPRYYNRLTADPYSRLRVPKYLKAWEVAFFLIFLVLYYSVVLERSFSTIPIIEIVFYVWLVSFFWDEVQEWADAGIFYLSDFWNIFDMTMIGIGIVFAILRKNPFLLPTPCWRHVVMNVNHVFAGVIGISTHNSAISDIAFDILSLEALLVIPRIGSFLSLSPYWGTLIPCLKEMGKDFIKFMLLVILIYLGFLTTFSLIARDTFSVGDMTWDITKIFYGNTAIGFDIMNEIDRSFGPPLMILFITMSSILLTGSLTGMLSNSFSRVMAQAREEYLYFYSAYVLEASTSSRLTHFYPPFNLVSLLFFKPWNFVFPGQDPFRRGRVIALKITHFPIVCVIFVYEWMWRKIYGTPDKTDWDGFNGGTRGRSASEAPKRPNFRPRGGRPGTASHARRLSDQLSPQSRPALRPTSAQDRSWSADDEDVSDGGGPSNAELLRRIDKLTELVLAMQERQLKS